MGFVILGDAFLIKRLVHWLAFIAIFAHITDGVAHGAGQVRAGLGAGAGSVLPGVAVDDVAADDDGPLGRLLADLAVLCQPFSSGEDEHPQNGVDPCSLCVHGGGWGMDCAGGAFAVGRTLSAVGGGLIQGHQRHARLTPVTYARAPPVLV